MLFKEKGQNRQRRVGVVKEYCKYLFKNSTIGSFHAQKVIITMLFKEKWSKPPKNIGNICLKTTFKLLSDNYVHMD
jgi:hypothetical protein